MTDDICVCGHEWGRHEHYRVGTDCGTCPVGECLAYRSMRGTSVAMLFVWLTLAVAGVGFLFLLLASV